MLEERLSSAYSQHSLGYGAPPQRQYANVYPSMPAPPAPTAADGKMGVENFYYGQPAAEMQPTAATPYAPSQWERDAPPDSSARTMTPGVYPPSAPVSWNGNAYPPSVTSPPPSNAHPAYPSQGTPAQYYARPEPETPYPTTDPLAAPSRASQYQYPPSSALSTPSAPPAAAPVPEQPPSATPVQSPGYHQHYSQYAEAPSVPALQQQATGPAPVQSYYFPQAPQHQPQPQQAQQTPPAPMPSAYPPQTQSQPVSHPGADISPVSNPNMHYQAPPPSRPAAEESLIEL